MKANKTKSKHRSNAKRRRSKPLLAKSASVRRAKPFGRSRSSSGKLPTSLALRAGKSPRTETSPMPTAKPNTGLSGASNGKLPISPLNPALAVIGMMGRVMGAYAEFPGRLARCRSPMDIWSEQARLVQRVFRASAVPAEGSLRAEPR
jgi:hypothetical protein